VPPGNAKGFGQQDVPDVTLAALPSGEAGDSIFLEAEDGKIVLDRMPNLLGGDGNDTRDGGNHLDNWLDAGLCDEVISCELCGR
jgi:hypothetical protein